MRKCTIAGKEYQVEYVFNMIGNYFFYREGMEYLVDAEDVAIWVEDNAILYTDGIDAAIQFAEEATADGDVFWWTAKLIENQERFK